MAALRKVGSLFGVSFLLLPSRLGFASAAAATKATKSSPSSAPPPPAASPASPAATPLAAPLVPNPAKSIFPTAIWTPASVRTGLIVKKLGMTQTWTEWGEQIPLTVLQVIDNEIVDVRTLEKNGYVAVLVGAINHPKPHKLANQQLGQFEKAGVEPKRHVREFKITQDALLPVGTPLSAAHFLPGQYVDVLGTTIGKGFQGGMKRHGFTGQPASHGVTKVHRSVGSVGAAGMARVWPGKRMPGHMGNVPRWQLCLQVYRVDTRWNVLYVKGAVPGHRESILNIVDAKRRPLPSPPPFPTAAPVEVPGIATAPKEAENPLDKLLYPVMR